MKKHFYYILVLSFFFGISSCKKTVINTPFKGNIKIRMSESVDSVKRVLNLYCYTEKIFECLNYGIKTTYSVTGNKIVINFIKITTPNICLTSPGPASTIISFTQLSNKIYDLEFNFGANKVIGQLNVSENSFVASIPTQTKIQFVNPDLKRVPENTIYGTVHYHSSSTSSIVQKFLDTLQLYGATPNLYQPGDYGGFQIEANGQIKQTQDGGYNFTQYYIFRYKNSSVQLKGLVNRFGENFPNLLLITLNTTKGETFYSWAQ